MRRNVCVGVMAVASLLGSGLGSGLAQTAGVTGAAGAKPMFDAVVIKPNHSGTNNTGVDWDKTTFKAENVTLKILMAHAYAIREGLIVGLTGWQLSDRFDINAKVVEASPDALKRLTDEQNMAMLAGMLEDRFALKVHRETKTAAVYELVVAKDGPKMTVNPKEGELDAETGIRRAPPSSMSSSGNELKATDVSMASLAVYLSKQLGRTVIDKTGLTAFYDLKLKWTPEQAASAEDAGPTLVTALQEQLGLKVQAGKGPVETLVVDHVEEPSEN
ncbi:TIGR03435 family protein [Granulicella tundricola]|nr:TIGR03435 family protein [Granulicella tundricola]